MKTAHLFITLLALLGSAPALQAAEPAAPLIAVAANFTGAMEKIAAAYEKETGIKVRTVFSSTGKLYAQIENSAPYDLFLAADARRPELLAREGLCEEPFIYATGAVVLWSGNPALAGNKNWREVIGRNGTGKIAIASPETAPYGTAALAVLEKAGLLPRLAERLVYGQNVAQAFQFADSGSAELGFIALSLALSERGRKGVYRTVPEGEAVVQKGCLMENGADREGARRFLAFFQRPETAKILEEFGYK